MLRGLPGSGKSMLAIQYVMKGYKRVNLDDLRLMIDNGMYTKQNEQYIQDVAQTMTILALQSKLDVIYDSVNLNPYHVKWAKNVAAQLNAELEIIDVDTPLEVCIARDLDRSKGRVGKEVIMNIYNKYVVDGVFPDVGPTTKYVNF